jgi:hypothetical protein
MRPAGATSPHSQTTVAMRSMLERSREQGGAARAHDQRTVASRQAMPAAKQQPSDPLLNPQSPLPTRHFRFPIPRPSISESTSTSVRPEAEFMHSEHAATARPASA